MKRWSATLLLLFVCSVVAHADVTIVQKTTAEGGMASMAQSGGLPTPTITTRIKGTKGRMDVDLGSANLPGNMSTITDAGAKQVVLLDHNQKTARTSGAPVQPATGQPSAGSLENSVAPTGRSQTIDGLKCDEYAFNTTMNLSQMGGAQVPPEAAAAMQGVTMIMKGSMWVAKEAPGAAEYAAYQKAMSGADLAGAAMGATGVSLPGMERMAKAMATVQGVPVLTEVTMTIEAGPGASDNARQMAAMMAGMGAMKVTTRVLSMKTDAIADDVFLVPAGYQVIK
ncbi:MAG TPA: hypothetical protein VGI12_01130 [Vicinamibacterales bacterium]|jgi:hypothetical protein